MITFVLVLINIILWVWFIGALFTLPFIVRFLFRTEEKITVANLVLLALITVGWFMCLEDLGCEIDDAFGLEGDKTVSSILDKIMNYEIMKTPRS